MSASVANAAFGLTMMMSILAFQPAGALAADPAPGPRAAAPVPDDIIVTGRRWALPSLQEVQDYNAAELARIARSYVTPVRKPMTSTIRSRIVPAARASVNRLKTAAACCMRMACCGTNVKAIRNMLTSISRSASR